VEVPSVVAIHLLKWYGNISEQHNRLLNKNFSQIITFSY